MRSLKRRLDGRPLVWSYVGSSLRLNTPQHQSKYYIRYDLYIIDLTHVYIL
jgi:hypothetical protein